MGTQITRRSFLARTIGLAGLSILGHGCQLPAKNTADHPNILLIVADDLGYGDLGCYGCRDTRTPAIDSLANDGVRFTTFYANAPECTPTRTALLTGRYQHRVGGLECALGIGNVGRYDDAIRLRESHDMGLPPSETSIARMLKNAGYATAICGKWHLGYERKFFPDKHGFDYWFGPVGGAVDYFHHCEYTGQPSLYENGQLVRRDGYLTDLITDAAVNCIDRATDQPLFLYVPYTAPHTPYQGPDDRKTEPVPQEEYNKGTRETFCAMVERMDYGIGRILTALDRRGLADNTLVIFMSDNGANRTGNNGPLSGHKGSVFEGGIRVPCIARWPGRLPADVTSDQACITFDFSRSIVRAAGAAIPSNRPFDGMDILRHVQDGRSARQRTLFWRARRGERTRKAVRHGDLKYIQLWDGPEMKEYLFDLCGDLAEEENLLSERTGDAEQLKRLLADWELRVRHNR